MCTSYWQARPSGRSASWCRSRPRRAPRRAGALAGQPRPRDPQRPANLRAVPGPGPAPRPGRRAQRSAVVLLCVLPVLGPGRVRRPLPLVLRIVVPTVPLRALTLPGLFAGTRGRGGKRDAGRDRRRSGAGLSPYQLGSTLRRVWLWASPSNLVSSYHLRRLCAGREGGSKGWGSGLGQRPQLISPAKWGRMTWSGGRNAPGQCACVPQAALWLRLRGGPVPTGCAQ